MGLILQYRRRAQSRFSLSTEVEQFAFKNRPAKNIYRIEMKDTQPGDDSSTGIGVYEYFNRNKDIEYEGHMAFRFGFSSIEQLNKWFYDKRELELMHEAGFVISVYRCKKYLIGSHQAIFLPKNSVKSYEISII